MKMLKIIICLILLLPVHVHPGMVMIGGGGGGNLETEAYKVRVETDGGVIINLTDVDNFYTYAKAGGYYNDLAFAYSAQCGIKKDESGYVEKWYDLSPNQNDAVQATGDNQPQWLANQQNGRAGIVFDGSNDSFTVAHDSSLTPATIAMFAVVTHPADKAWETVLCKTSSLLNTDGYGLGEAVGSTSYGGWVTQSHTSSCNLDIGTYVLDVNYNKEKVASWDNNEACMYSSNYTSDIPYSGTPDLTIGNCIGGTAWAGKIMEIIVVGSGAIDNSVARGDLNSRWAVY